MSRQESALPTAADYDYQPTRWLQAHQALLRLRAHDTPANQRAVRESLQRLERVKQEDAIRAGRRAQMRANLKKAAKRGR